MEAYLFDGAPRPVQILPEAVAMGGSWEGNVGRSVPIAWESHLVQRVYEWLRSHHAELLVDVGANTGSYALLPALLPDLRVIAFEPNAVVRQVLEQHLRLNGIADRVQVWATALHENSGSAMLRLSGHNASGCATLGQPLRFGVAEEYAVATDRLDALALSAVDFLKIDTEGAEKFVLEGAKATIARCKPTLLIECQPMNTAGFDYDAMDIPAQVERYHYRWEWASVEDIWCEAR